MAMKCCQITILATQRSLGHSKIWITQFVLIWNCSLNREQSWETGYYLLEESGNRRFAYKMGLCEAGALYWNLKNPKKLLPWDPMMVLRVQFFHSGGKLQNVIVDKISLDLKVLNASLRLQQDSEAVTAVVRPSDAFNLAVSLRCADFHLRRRAFSSKRPRQATPYTVCARVTCLGLQRSARVPLLACPAVNTASISFICRSTIEPMSDSVVPQQRNLNQPGQARAATPRSVALGYWSSKGFFEPQRGELTCGRFAHGSYSTPLGLGR